MALWLLSRESTIMPHIYDTLGFISVPAHGWRCRGHKWISNFVGRKMSPSDTRWAWSVPLARGSFPFSSLVDVWFPEWETLGSCHPKKKKLKTNTKSKKRTSSVQLVPFNCESILGSITRSLTVRMSEKELGWIDISLRQQTPCSSVDRQNMTQIVTDILAWIYTPTENLSSFLA